MLLAWSSVVLAYSLCHMRSILPFGDERLMSGSAGFNIFSIFVNQLFGVDVCSFQIIGCFGLWASSSD